MALFNQGLAPKSDILSFAMGECGLILSETEEASVQQEAITGGSLSLETTTTPTELLNSAWYLDNQSTDVDISEFLQPFTTQSGLKSLNGHDNIKTTTLHTSLSDVTDFSYNGNVFQPSVKTEQKLYNSRLESLLQSDNELNITSTKNFSNISTNGLKTQMKVQPQVFQRTWPNDITEIKKEARPNVEEEEEEEDDDIGYADTYTEYMPSKLKIGRRHPDSVVETSSLSSVAPPNIWYRSAIEKCGPKDIIERGFLSALQLEAVVYASQRHETMLGDGSRAGFLIGDGAGVGKGRTVAGIIFENYLLGRKRALWLSVSNDLKYDAIRDLRDIKCNAAVRSLNKFKYDSKLSSKDNGGFKKGVLFATYSSLIGESQGKTKYRTRLGQIVKWCGTDYEGVIILDECHKAKNLVPSGSSKPTKTGKTVLELQTLLPKARVVYCSATGASEPKNMAYMSRLGIWGKGTPFKEFNDFIQAIERRGVGAMELVAMDMKMRGMYIARQLSFSGVTFDIKEVPLNSDFIEMYNASTILWQQAREKFEKAAEIADSQGKMRKTLWGQFWAAHQRFFKYMCIASKVEAAVAIAKNANVNNKCVVIGLQSTGEARTLEQLGETGELTEFVSTAKGVFQSLIEKHFPIPRETNHSYFDDEEDEDENFFDVKPTSVPKKRKANSNRKSGEKKFKREDLYGHSGLSGDEMNSDNEDEFESVSDSSIQDDKEQSSKDDEDFDNDDDCHDDDSDSDSDEDNWLKQIKEKPKKKVKCKPRDSPSFPDETSMDALAAAGLNVNNLTWNKPASTTAVIATPKAQSSGSSTSFDYILSQLNNKPKCNSEMPPVAGLLDFIKAPSISDEQVKALSPVEQCRVMKTELLNKLDFLGYYLPNNTLDQLMDDLGGPQNVAEMTGRKGRIVSAKDGSVSYESRSEGDVALELLNIAEKKRFMEGEKTIAIISEAASSGISLQADRRAKNQKRRVHITLELPWSADKAIQQFGRTHRSNQVSAPEYLFLISKLSGEQRFASIVAKRLESLGALTHGDRRATESRDLSKFNVDNKYGRNALELVFRKVVGMMEYLPSEQPSSYNGNFKEDVRQALVGVGLITDKSNSLDKDHNNISKFLNRLLGIEVNLQNALFEFFTNTLAGVIQRAKHDGKYDEGISDLGSQGEDVHCVSRVPLMEGDIELHTVRVERGMSWDKAVSTLQDMEQPNEGFYLSRRVRNDKQTAILVKNVMAMHGKKLYNVYRPNTGLQQKQQSIEEIKKSYQKVALMEAKDSWIDQYNYCENQCAHSYWKGNCKNKTMGLSCSNGLRTLTYHILSGSVLKVWTQVESIIATQGGSNSRMRIIRAKTVDGLRIVGSSIPSNCVTVLLKALTLQPAVTGDKYHPVEIN